jgi:PIN domain nuclease of toxin-antitoxin system
MSVLVDTHILFWWLTDDPLLLPHHRKLIVDSPVRYVSAVSGWEIAVKVRLRKWPEARVLLPDISSKVKASGFDILPLTLLQAEIAGSFSVAHRDPFDRCLAAQALDLDLTFVTVDAEFAQFGCKLA